MMMMYDAIPGWLTPADLDESKPSLPNMAMAEWDFCICIVGNCVL